MTIPRNLNIREISTILHGLRMIQENANGHGDCMAGCCDHFDEADELNDVEIDNLCEFLTIDALEDEAVSLTVDPENQVGHPSSEPTHPHQTLLNSAAEAQTAYWDSLSELEEALGFDVDGDSDLENVTVEHLMEKNQERLQDHEANR